MELCLNAEGDKKLQYLKYFMHRINLLRHYKITPVVVFDGGSIPCKAATEQERHRRRKSNRDLAMARFKEGDLRAASELFQRAVSVTPSMAHQLIQILRSEDIEFLVAPYEADAQLAYLSSIEAENGGIVAVISEDSDLLAYGCPAIVFKMDQHGNGEEIVLDKVFESVAHLPSFRNFDKELFTGMCVLAGCDFLPSVPGIGICKAYSLVSKYRNLDRVLSILKFEKSKQMPEDYLNSFKEAIAVFQHARIYDPESKKLRHIKPLPQKLLQGLDEKLDFLGPAITPSVATAIAEGILDPCTMEAFDHFPSPGIYQNFTSRSPDQLLRPEATAVSTQSKCFTIISSQKTRKERTTESKLVLEDRKQQAVSKRKYSNEAGAMEKLVMPSHSQTEEETRIVPNKVPLLVPNNNPFKKRKLDEVQLDQTDSGTQQVSAVTEVENLDILSFTPESQESVNSKSIKATDGKKRGKSEKKLKRNNYLNVRNNSSILNFFPRL